MTKARACAGASAAYQLCATPAASAAQLPKTETEEGERLVHECIGTYPFRRSPLDSFDTLLGGSSRPFGIDVIYVFHRCLAWIGLWLITLHFGILWLFHHEALGVLNPLEARWELTSGRGAAGAVLNSASPIT